MTDAKEETKWAEPAETEDTFNKLKAFLDEGKVEYAVSSHKPVLTSEEAAEVRGVSLASGAKAMLLKDSGKKLSKENTPYYMAVISSAHRFSSKQFKKVINCKNFRFATPEELYEVTNVVTGALPPFGKIFNVPVYVDRGLSKEETINFNAGLRTHSITMKYEDFFKVEAPVFHVFTEEEIALGDLPAIVEEKKADNREAKKAERLAQRQKKVEEDVEVKWDPKDPSAQFYGEREINRSQGDPELRFTKKTTDVKDIDESLAGQKIIVRGRLHTARGTGGLTFIVLRQRYSTIQGVLQVADNISKGMVTYARKIPRESIVEMEAEVTVPEKPIESCTQQKVELKILTFFVINKSAPMLPF